jgi:hypothetical protein
VEKYGHLGGYSRAAMPATWRWRLRAMAWEQPDVVILIGAGVVLLISTVAVIFFLVDRDRRSQG